MFCAEQATSANAGVLPEAFGKPVLKVGFGGKGAVGCEPARDHDPSSASSTASAFLLGARTARPCGRAREIAGMGQALAAASISSA
jgi:hypothetical protein